MSLVKILGAVDGTISIKTHLKGAFGLSGILDLAFFSLKKFDMMCKKDPGSIIRSTSSQTFAVSAANNDLVDMCPNI